MDSDDGHEVQPTAEMCTTGRLGRRGERGAGLVEYTLIIALIALACVAGVTQFGEAIRDSDMKSISTSI